MDSSALQLAYHPGDLIIFVSYPKQLHIQTAQQITDMFDSVVEFWRDNCGGRKVYFVVDYTNLSVNLAENDFYAQELRRTSEVCAITIVRYGGDPITRTGARLRGIKLHTPSNLYASRE